MQSSILQNILYNRSFWSNQEIQVSKDNNLHITTCAFSKLDKNIIPIDLIEPQSTVKFKPDTHLIMFTVVSFFAALAFAIPLPLASINLAISLSFSLVFTGMGIASLIAAYKRSTRTYGFYFANTTTQVFTLRESEQNKEAIQSFISKLTQQIEALKSSKPITIDGNVEFSQHLDFLYNHGVVNDVFYERINHNIYEKVNGIEPKEHLAEVILLPVKKA